MSQNEWKFEFVLSGNDSQSVDESDCDWLIDQVITMAESKGLVIGGGFKPIQGDEE